MCNAYMSPLATASTSSSQRCLEPVTAVILWCVQSTSSCSISSSEFSMVDIADMVRCDCIISFTFRKYGSLFGANCLHFSKKCFVSSCSSWQSLHVGVCCPLVNLCLSVCSLYVPVASLALIIAFFVSAGLLFELFQIWWDCPGFFVVDRYFREFFSSISSFCSFVQYFFQVGLV